MTAEQDRLEKAIIEVLLYPVRGLGKVPPVLNVGRRQFEELRDAFEDYYPGRLAGARYEQDRELDRAALIVRVRSHLVHSFFPALPDVWADSAVATIWAVEEERWDAKIDVTEACQRIGVRPSGAVEESGGRVVADPRSLLQFLKLDGFLSRRVAGS